VEIGNSVETRLHTLITAQVRANYQIFYFMEMLGRCSGVCLAILECCATFVPVSEL
jgi:hypothetical protein